MWRRQDREAVMVGATEASKAVALLFHAGALQHGGSEAAEPVTMM